MPMNRLFRIMDCARAGKGSYLVDCWQVKMQILSVYEYCEIRLGVYVAGKQYVGCMLFDATLCWCAVGSAIQGKSCAGEGTAFGF